MISPNRRMILGAGLAAPFISLTRAAHAEAPMMGASFAHHRRFTLGNFEVTTILAGFASRDNPQGTYGMNVSAEEFAAVSEANFLSTETFTTGFAPVVVNTGSELVLFDTGLNPEGITGALEGAGYSPDQIDTVVITHMHGDHIGGIYGDAPTFANARFVTGRAEFDHWAASGNDRFEGKVRPLADQFAFLEADQDVSSGITAISSPGHTPGHMGYMLDSNGQQLMIMADMANHPVWSLAYPDWEVRFDMDKETAAASRRRVLDMLATDRIPATGYHLPFPSIGYIDRHEDGFRWIPESGQLSS